MTPKDLPAAHARRYESILNALNAMKLTVCLSWLQALAAYHKVHSAHPHNLECLAQLFQICTNLGGPPLSLQLLRRYFTL